jgi:long-chain acyl-CoA synthetase
MTGATEMKTLADVPRVHGLERPDDVALVFANRVATYKDWDGRCNQVAHGLIAEGVKPQARIAFLDKNSDHYFELLFGAAKANAVMVGINWRLAAPEVSYIINDAQAEILFVGPDFYALASRIAEDLTSVRKIIAMDENFLNWAPYEMWVSQQPSDDPNISISAGDIAIQMYTSGTTGRPKGVQLSHGGFFANNDAIGGETPADLEFNEWSQDDVSLVAMPAFHIGGTGWGIQGLAAGAKNVVIPEFGPQIVLDMIQRYKITKIFMVPAAMQLVLQDSAALETDYASIKYILYGASPIPLDLLREAIDVFQCGFVQLYGMTEATGSVTYLPADDHTPEGNERMRSAGKPFPGVEISIMNEKGEKLPTGSVGEICVKSAALMKGYWNLDDATKATITEDGWLRSGDAGYLDGDGYVYVHDRVKDMIVSGGENIYPAEVESALFGHPGVADVAVIGVPDEKWGEAVKAVVVAKPGKDLSEDEIRAFARERIAAYKTPKSVDFIDELPRNPSGKILKRELRAPYWKGRKRQVN